MTEKRKAYKKAYQKAYREAHRAEVKEYNKKYYEDNKTEAKAYGKRYKAVHKDELKIYQKEYYEVHKTKKNVYMKKYYEAHKAYQKFHKRQLYCSEEISKIENYELAKKDNFVDWDIHHRLETHNSDGERRLVDLTTDELKELGVYYNRPASELIFMRHKEHISLHKGKKNENKKDKLQTVEQTSLG